MLRPLLVALILVLVALTTAPSAAAAPDDKQCLGVYDCDGLIGVVKRKVAELDPRDDPCTCDPQPRPW